MKRGDIDVYEVRASRGSFEISGHRGSNWVSITDLEPINSDDPGQQYHFTVEIEVTKPDDSKITFGSDPVMINKPGLI